MYTHNMPAFLLWWVSSTSTFAVEVYLSNFVQTEYSIPIPSPRYVNLLLLYHTLYCSARFTYSLTKLINFQFCTHTHTLTFYLSAHSSLGIYFSWSYVSCVQINIYIYRMRVRLQNIRSVCGRETSDIVIIITKAFVWIHASRHGKWKRFVLQLSKTSIFIFLKTEHLKTFTKIPIFSSFSCCNNFSCQFSGSISVTDVQNRYGCFIALKP